MKRDPRKRMSPRKRLIAALIAAAVGAGLAALPASSPTAGEEAKPALSLTSLATPTAFVPGDSDGDYTYDLRIANLGAESTDGSDIVIADTLPAGLAVKGGINGVSMLLRSFKTGSSGGMFDYGPAGGCEIQAAGGVETVTCTISEEGEKSLAQAKEPAILIPGAERRLLIHVEPTGISAGETLTNHVEVEGGNAPPAAIDVDNVAATFIEGEPQPAPAGLSFFHAGLTGLDGQPVDQAAAHPYQFTIGFAVNTKTPPPGSEAHFVPAGGDVKDIRVTLPPGLVGNTNAVKRCSALQFSTVHTISVVEGPVGGSYTANECPAGSAVGMVLVQEIEGESGIIPLPLYNLVPPPGEPAQFGTQILGFPFYVDTEVRPDDHYKIVATLRNLSQAKRLVAATAIFWGAPADERHDRLRGACINQLEAFPLSRCSEAAGIEEKAFLRLPTNCESPLDIAMNVDTWSAASFSKEAENPVLSGCNQLNDFNPTLKARPTTDVADSPSGLHVELHLPQNEKPEQLGTADLRKAVLTLPEGLVGNPSAANGLDACSEAQIGFKGGDSFSDEPAHCPAAARIGSAEVHTPLLDHVLKGSVYLATPHANPFGSLLATYLAIDDPQTGIIAKIAGKAEPDPQTGRLTVTFDETPQVPNEDIKVKLFEGAAAPLRTPPTCNAYSTTSTMTPWSAPESGPPVTRTDTYAIAKAPNGGPCPSSPGGEPNSPAFKAGTISPVAGAESPLVIHLRREDGSQEFGSVTLTPPPGLLARLAGIPYCPEANLAAAAGKSGAAEKANPSCPAASRVGSVDTAVGAGPAPYWAQGTAYLAGPYKGAPLSLAVIAPAVAGPFDLGTVVSRAALRVNPVTFEVTAETDPLPHILQGIPLDIRQVVVKLDHPGWGINPTSCDPLAFNGQLLSTLGQAVALKSRFQVGECGRLHFKPSLSLKLSGPTARRSFPRLRAVYKPRPGDANLRHLVLRFPRSEFIEQGHFRTICTRVQYAASACPKGSVYGHVRVFTPLLDQPLEGPVYLRSSNHTLPDVVFALHGQIDAEVAVRVDSVHGGLRTTVEEAPDAPVSKVVVQMQGGAKGLFVNSRNICAHEYRADLKLDAHNGKTFDAKPPVRNDCAKKHHHRRKAS